jgi:hypothetical protein
MTTVTSSITKVHVAPRNSLLRKRNKIEVVNSSSQICAAIYEITSTFGVAVMQSPKESRVPNAYETPCLKKLKPEEAIQFLLCHANNGDSGAKELLHLVLLEHKVSGN